MSVLITICARGGSKGVPGKNIKELAGKPLIGYSIELAKKFLQEFEGKIEISTDDGNILDVVRTFGVDTTYIRPNELANDTASKVDAIKHLKEYTEEKLKCSFDFVLDLDVTSPLRNLNDLKAAFKIIMNDNNAQNLFSVSKANRNPYFNMVEKKDDYYVKVKKLENIYSRQQAPLVYDMNASFYFFRKSFFDLGFNSVFTEKSLIYEVSHLCFDIDEPIDFEIMEFLITNNRLDFEL